MDETHAPVCLDVLDRVGALVLPGDFLGGAAEEVRDAAGSEVLGLGAGQIEDAFHAHRADDAVAYGSERPDGELPAGAVPDEDDGAEGEALVIGDRGQELNGRRDVVPGLGPAAAGADSPELDLPDVPTKRRKAVDRAVR